MDRIIFYVAVDSPHTLKYKSESTLRNLTDLKANLSPNVFGT